MTTYAIAPSPGMYGSGSTVYSLCGTRDAAKARRLARKLTNELRRDMQRHGGTSGSYRVVETDRLVRAGDVVADFGWQADQFATVA